MMKKKQLVSSLAALSMVASGAAAAGIHIDVHASTQKEVTASWLTVRSAAGPQNKAVDWLPKGTDVTVLSSKSGWDYIEYGNGERGYSDNDYLKTVTVKASTTRTVTAYRLTLRNGAGPTHKILGYLKEGTKVNVMSYKGDWAYVSVGKDKGYVHEGYLSGKKTTSSSTTNKGTTMTVTSYWLTLRDGAGVSNQPIGYLEKGTKVNVMSYKGDWAYVTVGKEKGYVHKDYLSGTSASKPTPKPTPSVPSGNTYKVKAGDTLWSISRSYNMTVSKLKSLNGLSSNLVRVGQTLKVTGSSTKPSTPSGVLAGKEIVIDPGHGGRFAGAQGIVHEEDITLQISLKVRAKLQNMGAKVIMTRTSDVACTPAGYTYAQDLACRPGVAVKNGSDMFVSIHGNAGPSNVSGTETWYLDKSRGDYKLSKEIYDELHALGLKGRGVKKESWSVLRNSGKNIPSTLIETAFVTNKEDAAKLGSSSYQDKMAQAIATGIANYYK